MNFLRREELLATFEDGAELYDRARPRYPQDLFDDVFEITGLAPGARLFEIGSGTGIATAVFAERGFAVVGVESGDAMAHVARQNLERFRTAEIATGSFESYEPGGTFDCGRCLFSLPLDRSGRSIREGRVTSTSRRLLGRGRCSSRRRRR